eukprot:4987637-Amphidinium_carterae.2
MRPTGITSQSTSILVWKQSIAHTRHASMANGVYSASIYYRRAGDMSIEFVPEHNGQEAVNFNLLGCMGPPMRIWNIDDWQRIDTSARSTLWLD